MSSSLSPEPARRWIPRTLGCLAVAAIAALFVRPYLRLSYTWDETVTAPQRGKLVIHRSFVMQQGVVVEERATFDVRSFGQRLPPFSHGSEVGVHGLLVGADVTYLVGSSLYPSPTSRFRKDGQECFSFWQPDGNSWRQIPAPTQLVNVDFLNLADPSTYLDLGRPYWGGTLRIPAAEQGQNLLRPEMLSDFNRSARRTSFPDPATHCTL